MEAVKEEIIKLCQRKEDILTGMRNSMAELHQRLQQELPESGDELTASLLPQSDLMGTDVSGQQVSGAPHHDDLPESQRGTVNSTSSSGGVACETGPSPIAVNQYYFSSPLCFPMLPGGLNMMHD